MAALAPRVHEFRIVVPPVSPGEARPVWSVMIPTYNCARHVAYALERVLAQDQGPDRMQIEVVDDASVLDDPEAVVAQLGGGRVDFYRQPQNVGHVRNFDTCIERARGHLVHLLHGDDAVRPGFYETMEQPFRRHPEIGAAFCRHVFIDEQGHRTGLGRLVQEHRGVVEDWLPKIAVRQRLQPPAMVVRREVYESLGGFDHRIMTYGEDWEMWARIAAHYPVWHEPEPLAEYRLHRFSLAQRGYPSGQNMRDIRQAIAIIGTYLPSEAAGPLVARARKMWALSAARKAYQAELRGDWRTAWIQVREGFRTSLAPEFLARVTYMTLRGIVRRGTRSFRSSP